MPTASAHVWVGSPQKAAGEAGEAPGGSRSGGGGGGGGDAEAVSGSLGKKAAEPDFLQDPRTRVERTIILQPGSNSLRIGRATDDAPTLVPHVLARLYKGDAPSGAEHLPGDLPAIEKDRERELLEVQRALQRSAGPARKSASSGSLSADTIEEEIIDDPSDAFEFVGFPKDGGMKRCKAAQFHSPHVSVLWLVCL